MNLSQFFRMFTRKEYIHSSIISPFAEITGWAPTVNTEELIKKVQGWSYSCINRNANVCAQVPLKLYVVRRAENTKKILFKTQLIDNEKQCFLQHKLAERVLGNYELEEVLEHPIITLMRQVNPYQNAYELRYLTFAFLEAVGNNYWWLKKGEMGMTDEIYPLYPQYIKVILNKEMGIDRYEYGSGIEKKKLKTEEVLHFRYPSMTDPILGAGPTQSGCQSIDLMDFMNRYEIASFKNGGQPGVILTMTENAFLSPEERKRIEADYRKKFGSVDKQGKFMVAAPGTELKEFGHSPREMSYLQGRKNSLEELCAVYGVPMSFVKVEDVSRANAWASFYLYTEYTINPKLMIVEQKLNEQFTSKWDDSLVLLFDDARPKDRDFRLKELQAHLNTKYSSVNEERALDGLEPVPWGDEPIMPEINMGAPEEEPEKPEEDTGKSKKVGARNPLPEPDLMPRVMLTQLTILFNAMLNEIVRNLTEQFEPLKSYREKAIPEDLISAIFDVKKWTERFEKDILPFTKGIMVQSLVDAMEKVNPEAFFNASSPGVLRALEYRKGQIRTIIGTTQTEIRRMVTQGISEGEAGSTIVSSIRSHFDSRYHAERVVRSETIWAHNEGTVQGWKQSGVVEAKQWDSSQDSRACELCKAMDGKIMGLDGNYFNQGDELEVNGQKVVFTYEEIKHPPLHPNCLTGDTLITPRGTISAVSKRWYQGEIHIFKTSTNRELTCTPNHPIFTRRGLLPANRLDVGSQIICDGVGQGETFRDWQDINKPSSIQEIAEAFFASPDVLTEEVPIAAPDFHYDGVGSKVAIIGTNRLLMNRLDASFGKHLLKDKFTCRIIARMFFERFGMSAFTSERYRLAFGRLMSRLDLMAALLAGHLRPFEELGFALSPGGYSGIEQIPSNDGAAMIQPFSNSIFGHSRPAQSSDNMFFVDSVTHKKVLSYQGFVYNLQTTESYYIANGMSSHNCRCSVLPVLIEK